MDSRFDFLWALGAALVAFGISAVLGRVLIPYLHKLKFGQTILDIGPQWHKNKQGTPTMGGIMFIVGITLSAILTFGVYLFINGGIVAGTYETFIGLGMAVCYGIVGFIDDYIKVVKKRNLGLSAPQKLVLQFGVAALYLVLMRFLGNSDTATIIPFLGEVELGFFYYIISALVIVGIVNAVNLNDGVDGLCGSITFFAAVFMMLISSVMNSKGMIIESAALAGGCLGFLLWNFHPAKVFMGDTGSLFLGGMVCAVVFSLDVPVLILPIGIVYLAEMFSVMLQVGYFKLTKGKRLFKMAPIHHHFEMCGWSEVKVVCVFSAVTALFSLGAFLLTYFGVGRVF